MDRSKVIAPCFVSIVERVVPTLASFSSRPCGLVREGSPLRVDRGQHYLIVEYITRMAIPTTGYLLVLASRLTNESMAYCWVISCTWPPYYHFCGFAWIAGHDPHLRPLGRPVFPDGGQLRGHSLRPHRSFSSLPRVPRSPTASLGPRNTYSLRVSRLIRLLLGAPFPVPSISCFFLYYETVGTAAGTVPQGSCHWFVNGESAGLTFSSFDSPLVGSVLSRCWCFTLRCLFFPWPCGTG